MGEFFKGWRRKAGLVTLTMAMLLSAAWMRSYLVHDHLFASDGKLLYSITSFSGTLFSLHSILKNPGPMRIDWPTVQTYRNDACKLPDEWKVVLFDLVYRDRVGGDALDVLFDRRTITFRVVPYWSLVLPLTLLSAWLIFAKPRKAKTATGSTP